MKPVMSVLAAVVAVALAGCDDPVIIDGDIASVRMYGSVTTAAGAPVPGAVLQFWVFYTPEDGPPYGTDTTDASGGYRADLTNWGTRFVVDAYVIAVPPESSGLLPDTALREGIVMGADADSVRVDFVLQPAP